MTKDSRYNHIIEYVHNVYCERFLEIGVCRGNTAKLILQNSKNKQIEYHGIDLFEDATPDLRRFERSLVADSMSAVLKKLRKYSHNVFLYKGLSTTVFPNLRDAGLTFNCIWIDGGHSFKTVKADFENYSQLLKPNGIIFFDDYTDDPLIQGIRRYFDEYLLKNNLYDVHIHGEKYVDQYRGYDYKVASVRKITIEKEGKHVTL